jgi:hypothetical protein
MTSEQLQELLRRAPSPPVDADLGVRVRARAARRRSGRLAAGVLAVLAAVLVVGLRLTPSDDRDALVAAVPPPAGASALPDPQAVSVSICLAGPAPAACRTITDVATIAALEDAQRAPSSAATCTPRQQQTYVVLFSSPNARAAPLHVPELCGPVTLPGGFPRPLSEAFRELVVALRPGRESVDEDHLVTVNHCGVDPVTFDGRTWTVQPHAFDATNAPATFSGRGRLEKVGETRLDYVDRAGARLVLRPARASVPGVCA